MTGGHIGEMNLARFFPSLHSLPEICVSTLHRLKKGRWAGAGRTLCLAALGITIATGADAQVLTGTLTDSTTGQVVPGALVSATHSTSLAATTTLSGERGTYELRLSEPGSYLITVRQIGLRPSRSINVRVREGERVRLDVQLQRIAVALAPVGIRERSVCGEQAGGTPASRQLLGEFLIAMQSLMASAQQASLTAQVTNYVQYLDPVTQVVQADTTTVSQGAYRSPFLSVSAADLSSSGFVRVLPNDEVLYLAPGPAVLASPQFIGRHCFRAVALPREPSTVGLFVEPRPGAHAPDIEGIARFDSATRALRSLTFRYVNRPPESGLIPATGFVEFARTPGGAWWVNAWHITAPLHGGGQRDAIGNMVSVVALHRRGGYVDTEGLPTRSGTLHLSVTGITSTAPSVAVLAGSGQAAHANGSPDFILRDVTPGTYRVVVTRAAGHDAPGAIATDTVTVTAGDTTDARMTLSDSAYGARDRLCGNGRRNESRGAVVLVLLNEEGDKAVRDREIFLAGARETENPNKGERRRTFEQALRSDAAGLLWMCDRDENDEVTLSRTPTPDTSAVLIGKIRRRELLLGHVFLTLSR